MNDDLWNRYVEKSVTYEEIAAMDYALLVQHLGELGADDPEEVADQLLELARGES